MLNSTYRGELVALSERCHFESQKCQRQAPLPHEPGRRRLQGDGRQRVVEVGLMEGRGSQAACLGLVEQLLQGLAIGAP